MKLKIKRREHMDGTHATIKFKMSAKDYEVDEFQELILDAIRKKFPYIRFEGKLKFNWSK